MYFQYLVAYIDSLARLRIQFKTGKYKYELDNLNPPMKPYGLN